jgi:hypothetical protein
MDDFIEILVGFFANALWKANRRNRDLLYEHMAYAKALARNQ